MLSNLADAQTALNNLGGAAVDHTHSLESLGAQPASSAINTGNIGNQTVAAANILSTARNLITDLNSTNWASFNGAGDAALGVTGVLPQANGGTGRSDGFNLVQLHGLNTINCDTVYNHTYITCYSERNTSTLGTLPDSSFAYWLNFMNIYSMHFIAQLGWSCVASTEPNRTVEMWVRERYMSEDCGWSNWVKIYNSTTITSGTTDLVDGNSALTTGNIYLVYS